MRTIYSYLKTKIIMVGALTYFFAGISVAFAHAAILAASGTPQNINIPYGVHPGIQHVSPYMMNSWNGYGAPGIDMIGMLVWIAIWILVITFIVIVVRKILASGKNGTSVVLNGTSAIEILKERYARGEIDTKEYEERKKALTHE